MDVGVQEKLRKILGLGAGVPIYTDSRYRKRAIRGGGGGNVSGVGWLESEMASEGKRQRPGLFDSPLDFHLPVSR